MNLNTDQRKNRSDQTGEALELQLKASAVRLDAELFVLADDAGLMIAGSRPDEQSEEVAALCPHLATTGRLWSGRLRWKTRSHHLTITPFRAGSFLLYLCHMGTRHPKLSTVLSSTRKGVLRILEME